MYTKWELTHCNCINTVYALTANTQKHWDTLRNIPPRPTSYTLYQLSTLPSIQWYGRKYGKGLQEFDQKANLVRQTMAFLHPGIQNYTTIKHNSKSSRNTVWKMIQIWPFYLALTAHQQQNFIYPWGNCQEGKQAPWKANSSCRSCTRTTYIASWSTHQEMVTRPVQFKKNFRNHILTQSHHKILQPFTGETEIIRNPD